MRETFTSRLSLLLTMIGVAVGLGNVWRFPYMVGEFGGAVFVLFYIAAVLLVGVPALMAEWSLGRHTRRGPVGAFARAGMPGGRVLGWVFFFGVTAATAYYTNALGWVLHYTVAEFSRGIGMPLPWPAAAVLPPEAGFNGLSFGLQLTCSGLIIGACAVVLLKGLRRGIERASRVLVPALFVALLVLIVRALTLPGAWQGVEWFLLDIDLGAMSRGQILSAMAAALGQAVFSLSLGGSFMVVYGSYLADRERLRANALWTAAGDLGAGLLAGLAILPAVIALGMEPDSGPGLLFFTLPKVFAQIPAGTLFGLLFFLALLGAAYLSDVAAFEVLVAGLTDNTGLSRRAAVGVLCALVFVFAIPPMLNMRIFVPWDLAFGSGFQTLGALLAVVAVGWCFTRTEALRQLAGETPSAVDRWLYLWLRYGVPLGILTVGGWWAVTELVGSS